jgi:uncharacterized protein YmfQ (DUF2313 family)
MTCPQAAPAPFACPSEDQIRDQAFALLPRGRAWQTHDGGPKPGGVLYGFWAAFAALVAFVNQRWCQLRREFWWVSASETLDLWQAEYGLPDPCDPFADLCTRVASLGGATCDFYQAFAARAGWSIACIDYRHGCGTLAGAGLAGSAEAGLGISSTVLDVAVFLSASPAFTGARAIQPLAGVLLAGLQLNCPPDIRSLQCLFGRIVHAHVTVNYSTI